MRSSLRSGERQGVSPPCQVSPLYRRAHALPLALRLQTSKKAYGGFSLIEVIIATAILMGSAVVLARLAGMGRDQSQKARLHSEAQQLCEQTLNELLLGMRPMELVEAMPLIPLPAPIEETRR